MLAKDPKHPGANHYYIHAVEASRHPEKALPSAERLALANPGRGPHRSHARAHLSARRALRGCVGDEPGAAQIDVGYIAKAPSWGYYGMYLVHNYGFLAFSASMEGRSAESNRGRAIRPGGSTSRRRCSTMMPGMDFFVSEPLLAMVRFGKWQDLLAQPRPDAKYPTLTALWLHAHGLAQRGDR